MPRKSAYAWQKASLKRCRIWEEAEADQNSITSEYASFISFDHVFISESLNAISCTEAGPPKVETLTIAADSLSSMYHSNTAKKRSSRKGRQRVFDWKQDDAKKKPGNKVSKV